MAATAILCGASAPSFATTFTTNFNSGVLDPNLLTSTPLGFGISLTDGQAVFSKTAGTGNGSADIVTNFSLLGDFTVSVLANRINPFGIEMGVAVVPTSSSGGFADTFFSRSGAIVANQFIIPGFGYDTTDNSAALVTFLIQRSGYTMSLLFNDGSGFNTLKSDTDASLAAPMQVDLFLVNEVGDTSAQQGTFDNFSITANQFSGFVAASPIAEPETYAMMLAGLGLLGFAARRRKQKETAAA